MDKDSQWWQQAVIYQIYPRSFNDSNGDGIGDLQGIIDRVDYLEQLGVDAVWLNPVYQSPNDDNGYDISNYRSIMDEFGTMKDMDKLLETFHDHGIKVIMDLVLNHTSDEHPWFINSRSSKNSQYRNYYIWKPGTDEGPPNNWTSAFGGSAWEYDPQTEEYYLHLFSRKQPDLNWENPDLRQDLYQMINWWLEKGIDGFRLDVINFISKNQNFPDGQPGEAVGKEHYANGPRIHEFLSEMAEKTFDKHRAMAVGETPFLTSDQALDFVGEDSNELDMVIPFEPLELDRIDRENWQIRDWELRELKNIISSWQRKLQEKNGWVSLYFNNHDQPRIVSRYGDDNQYHRQSATMLATLLFTLRGTPFIYQGEEIGMTNTEFSGLDDFDDIGTRNFVREAREAGQLNREEILRLASYLSRDNARTPKQWDDSRYAGFTTGQPWLKVNPDYPCINVKKALADQDSILHYYKKLIKLRKKYPSLVYDEYRLLLEDDPILFTYLRRYQDQTIGVILNFVGDKTPDERLPGKFAVADRELLLGNYGDDPNLSENLRPYEARIYKL
ncbi:MAG: alpha-glucosidase [Bacillota bacterium]